MKTILFLIIFLLLASFVCANEWNAVDKILFGSFICLQAIDYNQTLAIVHDPYSYELNPIMGRHPSDREIGLYFLGSTAINYLIADALSPKYKRMWLMIGVLVQAVNVSRNYGLGWGIEF